MYKNDKRLVITLDAGGTNFVFSAMQGCEFVVNPITTASNSDDLDLCLATMVNGFEKVIEQLPEKPVAISFAFPGPADYRAGIIGGYLPNFPSFRDGVALGPYLENKFQLPVYINNDGDLFAYGEATVGVLPALNVRLNELGHPRHYHNLLGVTFGTGLGIGSVINNQLNLGNNSCIEAFCMTNRNSPRLIAEEGASIRAIKREYAALSGDCADLSPLDIFNIAEGSSPGHQEAAIKSFELFGEVAGDVIATAITLTDSIVVLGGGITGAMKYIKPGLFKTLRSSLETVSGESVARVQSKIYDLDNELEFAKFVIGDPQKIQIPGTDREVIYDSLKRSGIIVSKLGAPKAISAGAYSYALSQIDAAEEKREFS